MADVPGFECNPGLATRAQRSIANRSFLVVNRPKAGATSFEAARIVDGDTSQLLHTSYSYCGNCNSTRVRHAELQTPQGMALLRIETIRVVSQTQFVLFRDAERRDRPSAFGTQRCPNTLTTSTHTQPSWVFEHAESKRSKRTQTKRTEIRP